MNKQIFFLIISIILWKHVVVYQLNVLKRTQAYGDKIVLLFLNYTFAVNVRGDAMKLYNEHTDYEWMDYKTAKQKLRYDSNKVAL